MKRWTGACVRAVKPRQTIPGGNHSDEVVSQFPDHFIVKHCVGRVSYSVS